MMEYTIAQWCFAHPYLACFMFVSLCAAIGNIRLVTTNKIYKYGEHHGREQNDK